MTPHSFYLAGPMTHYPKFNFPAFDAAAATLRDAGYDIVSPAELDDEATRAAALASPDGAPGSGAANGESYGTFLSRDVKLVIDEVDGVVVLPGWMESRGAKIEVFTALTMGKPIWRYEPDTQYIAELEPPIVRAALGLVPPEDPRLTTDEPPADPPFGWEPTREPGHIHSEIAAAAQRGEAPTASGEVRITDPETGGAKGRKDVRMDLIPWEPVWEVARVYGKGDEKYPPDESGPNYLKGFDWSLSYGAALRHLTQWASGEDYDEEFGTHHLAHVAWHCFALMLFQWHDLGRDDRLTTLTGLLPGPIVRTGRSEAARS